MVTIVNNILFQEEKKQGRKSKQQLEENAISYSLQYELYKNYLKSKEDESAFIFATVQTYPLKNMFAWLCSTFETIELEITPKEISLNQYCFKKSINNKQLDTRFLFLFREHHKFQLIHENRSEKYECKTDKITLELDTNDLNHINDYITPECVVYLFVNKQQYNIETKKSGSVEFHISTQIDKILLSYDSLLFTCKETYDTSK